MSGRSYGVVLFCCLSLATTGCGDDAASGPGTGTDGGVVPGADTGAGGGGNVDGGNVADVDAGGGGGGTSAICAEECSSPEDCLLGGSDAAGFTCTAGRCVVATGGCTMDAECTAQASGWFVSCTTDAECPGQVCIAVSGGVCASAPSLFVSCADLMQEDWDTTKQEDGSTVTVCRNPNSVCNTDTGVCGCANDAACATGQVCQTDTNTCECADDSGCIDAMHPSCNAGTGQCGCTTDSCGENRMCDRDSGMCVCANDEGCGGYGRCNDGLCTCDDAATDCSTDTVFDGTVWVCADVG